MPKIILREERIYPGAWIRYHWEVVHPETELPVDPSSFVITVRGPDNVRTTYEYGVDTEFIRDGVGEYHIDIEHDAPRRWFIEGKTENPFDIVQYALTVREGKFN